MDKFPLVTSVMVVSGDPSINSDDQDSAKNLAPLRSDMNNPNDENQSTSLSSVADEESPDSQDPADATITNAMDNDDDDDDRRMPSATAAASHSHVHDGVRANSEIDKSHAQELLASKNMLARLIVLSYARVLASMEEEFVSLFINTLPIFKFTNERYMHIYNGQHTPRVNRILVSIAKKAQEDSFQIPVILLFSSSFYIEMILKCRIFNVFHM